MTVTTSASTAVLNDPATDPVDPAAGLDASTDTQDLDARVDDWATVLGLPPAPRRLRAVAVRQVLATGGAQ